MEKIWYDPHEKSPRVDRILSQMSNLQTFELTQRVKAILQDKKKISPIPDIWRLRKQKNQSFFPEIGIQLKIELFQPEESNFEVDESLEQIVSQMENLESLFIDIKSNWAGFCDIYIPALRGLKSCTKLKELVVGIEGQFFSPLYIIDEFVNRLYQFYDFHFTRLKIQGEEQGFIHNSGPMSDLLWIPRFKNLEELSFTFNENLSIIGILDGIFYDNPMESLKHLKIELMDGFGPEFFMNLHKAFPNLESFTYIGYGYYQGNLLRGIDHKTNDAIGNFNLFTYIFFSVTHSY